jgi:curved DNA-binding protein CbpA
VALELHPDKCGAATADEETKQKIEDRFKRIQEAYEVRLLRLVLLSVYLP